MTLAVNIVYTLDTICRLDLGRCRDQPHSRQDKWDTVLRCTVEIDTVWAWAVKWVQTDRKYGVYGRGIVWKCAVVYVGYRVDT